MPARHSEIRERLPSLMPGATRRAAPEIRGRRQAILNFTWCGLAFEAFGNLRRNCGIGRRFLTVQVVAQCAGASEARQADLGMTGCIWSSSDIVI